MTLRLRVGRKGYIIIPKSIREAVGIREGDYVEVSVEGDRIVLRPTRKVDLEKLRENLRRHAEKLKKLNTIDIRPGEASRHYLEEEFEY